MIILTIGLEGSGCNNNECKRWLIRFFIIAVGSSPIFLYDKSVQVIVLNLAKLL